MLNILCFLIVGVVSAITFISYLKRAVSTEDVGVNNDGVLMAIENLDWYQQIDMDYKDLGDGYKIKMEHLSMDEMCLYMIFDLQSEKDIHKLTDVSLSDLRIIDENSNLICDKSNMNVEQYAQVFGSKLIENDKHHIRFLVYMYTDSFPVSKTLDISFSNIVMYKKAMFDNKIDTINYKVDFVIDLLDKFTDRTYISYTSSNNLIQKAIISDTGFYVIIGGKNLDNQNMNLRDTDDNQYQCYLHPFTQSNELIYIIISKFNNYNSTNLVLSSDTINIELIKDN